MIAERARVHVTRAQAAQLREERLRLAHRGDREDVKRDFGGTLGALGDLIGGDR